MLRRLLAATALIAGCETAANDPADAQSETTQGDAATHAASEPGDAAMDAASEPGDALDAGADATCAQLTWDDLRDPDPPPSTGDAGALTVQGIAENPKALPRPAQEYTDLAPTAVSEAFGLYWANPGSGLAAQTWTVVAPALGDQIVIRQPDSFPAGRHYTGPAYDAELAPLATAPDGAKAWTFAGDRACAAGSVNLAATGQTSASLALMVTNSDCALPEGRGIVAVANDALGRTLGVTHAGLPAPAAEGSPPPSLEFEPWATLESVPLQFTGNANEATYRTWIYTQDTRAALESRAQSLTVSGEPQEGGTAVLQVPRALADSLEVEVRNKVSPSLTIHTRTRQAASATEIALEQSTELPRVTSVTMPSGPCGEDARITWTLADGPKGADAVVLVFGQSWRYTSTTQEYYRETMVLPPDALSAPVRQFQGKYAGAVGPLELYDLESITYIDADYLEGYRDFLRDPLREDEDYVQQQEYMLQRALPVGATVRSVTYTP